MFGMTSTDTMATILLTVYGLYCAWGKYCERRWTKPPSQEDERS